MMALNKNFSEKGLNYKLIYKALIAFAALILLQLISVAHAAIIQKEFWAPVVVMVLEIGIFFLAEAFGLLLFIYLKLKKAPLEFWLPPFLNLIGLLIFVSFFLFFATTAQFNLFESEMFGSVLTIVMMIVFYGLKIAALVTAVRAVMKLSQQMKTNLQPKK